jgi:hypothetical protein
LVLSGVRCRSGRLWGNRVSVFRWFAPEKVKPCGKLDVCSQLQC